MLVDTAAPVLEGGSVVAGDDVVLDADALALALELDESPA